MLCYSKGVFTKGLAVESTDREERCRGVKAREPARGTD